jgi:UDP-glucuronate 4-epimerase
VRSFGDVFDEYVRRNLIASRRVFETAAAAGVRVVFASSSSIYGDAERYPTPEDTEPRPISPYGITKHGCEQLAYAYAKEFGLDVVVLRYFTFYGPRQRPDMALTRIVDALARGTSFELYGDGLQSRSFTYVADGVAANIAAMERAPAGAVYNVGGGQEATMREAIETLERVSGRSLDVVERPAAAGDVRRTSADTKRIERDLHWRATTALEDGLRAQWEWASVRVAAP